MERANLQCGAATADCFAADVESTSPKDPGIEDGNQSMIEAPESSANRKLPVLYSQLVLDRLLSECLWRQPA